MKLNFKSAKFTEPGKRVNQSKTPQLLIRSTFNQLGLNEKARELLGVRVETGVDDIFSRIYIWDPVGQTDENGMRYLIMRGFQDNAGNLTGAKLGGTYSCSYSPIWGNMHANNPMLDEPVDGADFSPADLERMGVLADAERKIAGYTGTYDIVPAFWTSEDREELTTTDTGIPVVIDRFGVDQKLITDDEGQPIEVPVYALVNPKFKEHDPKSMSSDDDE